MVKFQWTNKILSAINVSTEWSDDVKGRVSEILREFKEAQNYTSTNTSSPKLPYDEVVTKLEIEYGARKWSLEEWKAVRKTYDIIAGKIGR